MYDAMQYPGKTGREAVAKLEYLSAKKHADPAAVQEFRKKWTAYLEDHPSAEKHCGRKSTRDAASEVVQRAAGRDPQLPSEDEADHLGMADL